MSEVATRRRRGQVLIVIAVVAVIAALAAVLAVVLTGARPEPTPPAPDQPAFGAPASAGFGFQPLFPFADEEQVRRWQQAYRAGGAQPWHLDPEATALAFTAHLGFTELTVVTASTVSGDEAWVTVGYPIEGQEPGVAAELHLARYGSGGDAPWEVVGSRDTDLTLTEPRYGSAAGSPVRVGGWITGVDESIAVRVHEPGSAAPLGQSCCLPAGGEHTPWSTTVAFTAPPGTALTIVASTGGHIATVERFAITGVRAT